MQSKLNSLIPKTPMARLITTEQQLRAHIPNIIASVKGETPLIEKLSLFIELAEEWVKQTFTSDDVFNVICNLSDSLTIKKICSQLVVAEAMLRAIPSLDIVLTPNGFGVVSTQNLAPASKPRVDRLIGSMLTHRDECIEALLLALSNAGSDVAQIWFSSTQAQFFGATLFQNLSLVDELGKVEGSRWEKYLQLRPQVIDLEASLAEEWFSPELMTAFRSELLHGTLSALRYNVVLQVKSQIVGYLREGSFNSRRLADIVNVIRQQASEFAEWHRSDVARQFSPPVYRNKKESSGYWF